MKQMLHLNKTYFFRSIDLRNLDFLGTIRVARVLLVIARLEHTSMQFYQ